MTTRQQLPDHEARLAQARQRAHYELGDSSWADAIVRAYCDPDADERMLAEELRDA